MTRHYEDILIPAETTRVLKKITCNLCGRTAHDVLYGDEANWKNSGFEFLNITIEVNKGMHLPDCHKENKEIFDLCPDCFNAKIRPLLGTAHEQELDY